MIYGRLYGGAIKEKIFTNELINIITLKTKRKEQLKRNYINLTT